jgi:hypothetical protein
MNIYETLNKINDTESLSEKYNVKNAKELKKLQESQIKRAKKIKLNESLSDTQEEAIDITKDYILDNYSWSDWDSNVEGSTLTFTIWFDDDWGGEDSSETIFKLDINKLVEYMNDEEDLGNYIESGKDYTNYEARGKEFYERAEKELENHFGCTNAYLEPSTQMGRGGTFLFADDMSFDGNFDYQTGEEYIREDNFEGFLQLCLDSFTPRVEESLTESEELTNYEKIMRVLDKWPDAQKRIDAAPDRSDSEADASSTESLRKREEFHREVWNFINHLRVKYKYSLEAIKYLIDSEIKQSF